MTDHRIKTYYRVRGQRKLGIYIASTGGATWMSEAYAEYPYTTDERWAMIVEHTPRDSVLAMRASLCHLYKEYMTPVMSKCCILAMEGKLDSAEKLLPKIRTDGKVRSQNLVAGAIHEIWNHSGVRMFNLLTQADMLLAEHIPAVLLHWSPFKKESQS